VVALFHGLEGSADRYYIIKLMRTLDDMNYSVVAVNFRSCGSRMNRQRRFYHSGETEDFHTVFSWIKRRFPDSPPAAVGFSLGGNALLKYLGEQGKNSLLHSAVAVSVPYDLKAGSEKIGAGFNQLYEYIFLKSLKKKLNQKRKTYPDLPSFSGSSLYAFDDQVTGPIHGFAGAEDYYARCSSGQFVPQIDVPTLLIHSKEDPICPADRMPLAAVKQKNNLDYIITDEGGHVGFHSRPSGWLCKTIKKYLVKNSFFSCS